MHIGLSLLDLRALGRLALLALLGRLGIGLIERGLACSHAGGELLGGVRDLLVDGGVAGVAARGGLPHARRDLLLELTLERVPLPGQPLTLRIVQIGGPAPFEGGAFLCVLLEREVLPLLALARADLLGDLRLLLLGAIALLSLVRLGLMQNVLDLLDDLVP